MDQHFIDVLEYLEPAGIGIYKDLSPLLQTMFQLSDKTDKSLLTDNVNKVTTLLNSLEDYIVLRAGKADRLRFGNVGQGIGLPMLSIWLDTVIVDAHITAFGLEFLNGLRGQRISTSVSKSVIKTNEATELLYKRQNRLYYVTLCIAILSVLFPALSYFRDGKVAHLNNIIDSQRESLERSQAQVKRLQASYDSLDRKVRSLKKSPEERNK